MMQTPAMNQLRMVEAGPGVVVVGDHHLQAPGVDAPCSDQSVNMVTGVGVTAHQQHMLVIKQGSEDIQITGFGVGQVIGPIGMGVGPGEQDPPLGSPFRKKLAHSEECPQGWLCARVCYWRAPQSI